MTTKRMQKKTQKSNSPAPVPVESVIHTVRGQKVILDTDLVGIYNVEIRRLNEQVKRNADRFPDDFMFRLTPDEWEEVRRLRSQNATLKRGQLGTSLSRIGYTIERAEVIAKDQKYQLIDSFTLC